MAPALSDRRRAHCRTSLPPASGIASVSDRMFDFGGEAPMARDSCPNRSDQPNLPQPGRPQDTVGACSPLNEHRLTASRL